MNSVQLQGRITKDLVKTSFKVENKDISKIDFRLAVRDGKDSTIFIPVLAVGAIADTICKFLKKGHLLSVVGKMRIETWKDKTTNETKSFTKVLIKEVHFCDSKTTTNDVPVVETDKTNKNKQ